MTTVLLEARDLLFARLLQYRAFKEVSAWFERSLRKMGRAAMAQMPAPFRAGGLRDYFGETSDRMRSRLRNDDAEDSGSGDTN